MKVQDIKNLREILKNNANDFLGAKTSIKLAKLKKEIDEHIDVFNDALTNILNECAEKDENGKFKMNDEGDINIIPNKQELWLKEYNELLNRNDFPITIRFTEDEINKLKFTPVQAETIIELIENPKD